MKKGEVKLRIAEVRKDKQRLGVFINGFFFSFEDWNIDYNLNYVYIHKGFLASHAGFCIDYEEIFNIK